MTQAEHVACIGTSDGIFSHKQELIYICHLRMVRRYFEAESFLESNPCLGLRVKLSSQS
jgi:hypothetical protein